MPGLCNDRSQTCRAGDRFLKKQPPELPRPFHMPARPPDRDRAFRRILKQTIPEDVIRHPGGEFIIIVTLLVLHTDILQNSGSTVFFIIPNKAKVHFISNTLFTV